MGRRLAWLAALALVAAACGDSGSAATNVVAVLDDIDAQTAFVATVDNPFLPFPAGASYVYESTEGEDVERIEITISGETRNVMGLDALIVRDVVSVDGEVIEDTFDWYVQDGAGNVWYVGEDSKEIEDGEVVSTAGSWEAGVDGARPGIIMYADPMAHAGTRYYQEFYEDEAVDQAEVLRIEPSVTVVAGTFEDVLVIREWNPLEPGVAEDKYYAPGVGVILEEKVEGGSERVELLSYDLGA